MLALKAMASLSAMGANACSVARFALRPPLAVLAEGCAATRAAAALLKAVNTWDVAATGGRG